MNPNNYTLFEAGSAPSDLGKPSPAGAAAAGGGDPFLTAGLVGVQMLQAHEQRKELERQERFQAKTAQINRTQNALINLANIGKALKL
jgi:hypothetical protein